MKELLIKAKYSLVNSLFFVMGFVFRDVNSKSLVNCFVLNHQIHYFEKFANIF